MLDLASHYLSPHMNTWSVHGLGLGQFFAREETIGHVH